MGARYKPGIHFLFKNLKMLIDKHIILIYTWNIKKILTKMQVNIRRMYNDKF